MASSQRGEDYLKRFQDIQRETEREYLTPEGNLKKTRADVHKDLVQLKKTILDEKVKHNKPGTQRSLRVSKAKLYYSQYPELIRKAEAACQKYATVGEKVEAMVLLRQAHEHHINPSTLYGISAPHCLQVKMEPGIDVALVVDVPDEPEEIVSVGDQDRAIETAPAHPWARTGENKQAKVEQRPCSQPAKRRRTQEAERQRRTSESNSKQSIEMGASMPAEDNSVAGVKATSEVRDCGTQMDQLEQPAESQILRALMEENDRLRGRVLHLKDKVAQAESSRREEAGAAASTQQRQDPLQEARLKIDRLQRSLAQVKQAGAEKLKGVELRNVRLQGALEEIKEDRDNKLSSLEQEKEELQQLLSETKVVNAKALSEMKERMKSVSWESHQRHNHALADMRARVRLAESEQQKCHQAIAQKEGGEEDASMTSARSNEADAQLIGQLRSELAQLQAGQRARDEELKQAQDGITQWELRLAAERGRWQQEHKNLIAAYKKEKMELEGKVESFRVGQVQLQARIKSQALEVFQARQEQEQQRCDARKLQKEVKQLSTELDCYRLVAVVPGASTGAAAVATSEQPEEATHTSKADASKLALAVAKAKGCGVEDKGEVEVEDDANNRWKTKVVKLSGELLAARTREEQLKGKLLEEKGLREKAAQEEKEALEKASKRETEAQVKLTKTLQEMRQQQEAHARSLQEEKEACVKLMQSHEEILVQQREAHESSLQEEIGLRVKLEKAHEAENDLKKTTIRNYKSDIDRERETIRLREDRLEQLKNVVDSYISELDKKQAVVTRCEDALRQEREYAGQQEDALRQEKLVVKRLEDALRQEQAFVKRFQAVVKRFEDDLWQEKLVVKRLEDALRQEKLDVKRLEDALWQEQAAVKRLGDALRQEKLDVKRFRDALQQEQAVAKRFEDDLRQEKLVVKRMEKLDVKRLEDALRQEQAVAKRFEDDLRQEKLVVKRLEDALQQKQAHLERKEGAHKAEAKRFNAQLQELQRMVADAAYDDGRRGEAERCFKREAYNLRAERAQLERELEMMEMWAKVACKEHARLVQVVERQQGPQTALLPPRISLSHRRAGSLEQPSARQLPPNV
ncbi:unnamed protein product [Chrysoparadoxa australica]